jgi:excisionase family DNA binding protein
MSKLIKPDQVAERLSVAPATIRKWIHSGRLPVVRLGRSVRVREEDCDALARFGGLPQERTSPSHLFPTNEGK